MTRGLSQEVAGVWQSRLSACPPAHLPLPVCVTGLTACPIEGLPAAPLTPPCPASHSGLFGLGSKCPASLSMAPPLGVWAGQGCPKIKGGSVGCQGDWHGQQPKHACRAPFCRLSLPPVWARQHWSLPLCCCQLPSQLQHSYRGAQAGRQAGRLNGYRYTSAMLHDMLRRAVLCCVMLC